MSEALVRQILIGLGVALFIRAILPPVAPAGGELSAQPWAGAGTDPFGMSYTVIGKAARGGM